MNLILCAHHQIGCRVLEWVLRAGCADRLAVFTHVSREHEGNVLELARAHGVTATTASVNRAPLPFRPDIIASVYYRGIIKPHVIEACGGRIFNAHPSLLPNHRGCSAVPWAIIEGDAVTGMTYHYIDEGIDTGRVLVQAAVQIDLDETQLSLYEKCMAVGARYWPAAFELVQAGFPGVPQLGRRQSYHRRGCPYGGEIQPGWSLDQVERFIRAMHYPPLPGARFRGRPVGSVKEYRALLPV